MSTVVSQFPQVVLVQNNATQYLHYPVPYGAGFNRSAVNYSLAFDAQTFPNNTTSMNSFFSPGPEVILPPVQQVQPIAVPQPILHPVPQLVNVTPSQFLPVFVTGTQFLPHNATPTQQQLGPVNVTPTVNETPRQPLGPVNVAQLSNVEAPSVQLSKQAKNQQGHGKKKRAIHFAKQRIQNRFQENVFFMDVVNTKNLKICQVFLEVRKEEGLHNLVDHLAQLNILLKKISVVTEKTKKGKTIGLKIRLDFENAADASSAYQLLARKTEASYAHEKTKENELPPRKVQLYRPFLGTY